MAPSRTLVATRILVVEDDPLLGMLVGATLDELGYAVCGLATTQDDAVADAMRHRPDLMIVDVRLGNGSGVYAMDEILRTISIRHFYMSGNLAQIRAIRPDVASLQKPFTATELHHAIQSTLASGPPRLAARPIDRASSTSV